MGQKIYRKPVKLDATGTAVNNASAILEINSTDKGVLPPRMTTTQKLAIASPATGLEVFDTTLNAPQYYNGTAWLTPGDSEIAFETWSTNANYTTINTTAKRLIILQTGTLTETRTLILSTPSTPGQEVVIVASGSISSTIKINITIAGKINAILNLIAIILPYSQTWITSIGGGNWSTSQASPQFTETSTALTSSKILRSDKQIGIGIAISYTAPWYTGVMEGDIVYKRSGEILAYNSAGVTLPFIAYNPRNGWENYRPNGGTIKYWNGQTISSGNKPIIYSTSLGFVDYYYCSYLLEIRPENPANNGLYRCIFYVNGTGVPSIIKVLKDSSTITASVSGGTINVTGVNCYATINQLGYSFPTELPELYESYSNDGQIKFLTQLGVGHASQVSSAILQADSTSKGSLATPRMTAAQRAAIASPVAGLIVYQTDVHAGYWYHDGTIWQDLSQPRVGTTASSATPTINTDVTDYYEITGQTVDITSFTTNLTGTPVRGQKLWIDITGTAARAITWGASFEASTIALPTTTVSTDKLSVDFIWNVATSKWRCIGAY
jgi:hypothetical protein